MISNQNIRAVAIRKWKKRNKSANGKKDADKRKRNVGKAKSQAVNSESLACANEKAEQNIVMENDLEISVKGEARGAPKRRKVDPAPTESVKSQLVIVVGIA